MLYKKETLDIPAKQHFHVIVEFNDGDYAVGLMDFSTHKKDGYCVRNLDGGSSYKIPVATHFSRSHVKRVVYLSTGYVLPKKDFKISKSQTLNILELNDLITKAGYEFI